MKCPVCKTASLKYVSLESQIESSQCSNCDGHWISASSYWNWLDEHGERLPEKEPDSTPIEISDVQRAKLCPECRRIMLRYKVGHGTTFGLDQCGSCQGFWFDKNEWEALKERNLHDEVHLIFSAPWQSEVRKGQARQFLDSMYTERFEGDYERLKQLKEWIGSHPEKELILDYLANPEPYSKGAPSSAIK
ncbi:zf-TFIIB domain-containing protein [Nodosilinea nodulosa]|uniref:TFIIB-type zinc ribbon-containing protein n=1 Tax=Nodosilinea nodulosa TaxID=416001 RepID=UPI0018C2B04A|nr:zf-TFIIB domain-containing protein [Nodosilinea nodulosa]